MLIIIIIFIKKASSKNDKEKNVEIPEAANVFSFKVRL
jgi:hypothetical protein